MQNKMETTVIKIDYTPAIDEIISLLEECGNKPKKISYNTIEVFIKDMQPDELIFMGMMIKSCEKSLIPA